MNDPQFERWLNWQIQVFLDLKVRDILYALYQGLLVLVNGSNKYLLMLLVVAYSVRRYKQYKNKKGRHFNASYAPSR